LEKQILLLLPVDYNIYLLKIVKIFKYYYLVKAQALIFFHIWYDRGMCILYRFFKQTNDIEVLVSFQLCRRGHHGHDRMVVGFTTTYAISAYTADIVSSILDQDEVYNM
jgi:hypothetical protein